jgi:hypothetical protein
LGRSIREGPNRKTQIDIDDTIIQIDLHERKNRKLDAVAGRALDEVLLLDDVYCDISIQKW